MPSPVSYSNTLMNYIGILVGAATFMAIGLCHPLVIKAEYYIGRKSWWLFLLAGLICSAVSVCIENYLGSTIAGAFAFSFFWGILEVFQQEKRVLKGWFPENPKRAAYYAAKRQAK